MGHSPSQALGSSSVKTAYVDLSISTKTLSIGTKTRFTPDGTKLANEESAQSKRLAKLDDKKLLYHLPAIPEAIISILRGEPREK